MLSNSQLSQIKNQLIKQIESLEEPQKSQLKNQIESMNDEELESFLIKNNMIKVENRDLEQTHSEQAQKCIFCSIINNEIPSYKIAENKKTSAILEINPVSDGHSLIIPTIHTSQEKIPSLAFSLAKKVSQKIKSVLKPKKVEIIAGEIFGHAVINVLPVYENEHLGMQRKKISEDKLKELQSKLEIKKRALARKSKKQEISRLPKAPRMKA